MYDKMDTETSTDVTDNNIISESAAASSTDTDNDDDRDDSNDTIEISRLMSMIMAMCGYLGYSDTTGIIGSVITKAKKSDVKGKTCRNILDELSRACCGVWLLQNDTGTGDVSGTITLIPVDSGFGAVFTAENMLMFMSAEQNGLEKSYSQTAVKAIPQVLHLPHMGHWK